MSIEQFDENKESVYGVCSTGGGYGWGTILYDSETGKWYEHLYYCGSVDICEDHDGGIEEINDKKYVIKAVIKRNELHQLIKYYKELDVESNLDEALEDLQKAHGGYLNSSRWLESPYHIYFRFANGDYSVWFSDVFYSPDDDGKCSVDYYAAKRILKEKDTVRFYKFNFGNNKWLETDWDRKVYSETDPIEYPKIEKNDDKKNGLPADDVKIDSSDATDKKSSPMPENEVETKPPVKKRCLFARIFGK